MKRAGELACFIDTNLPFLLIVGRANRLRIGQFKRTRSYTSQDHELLLGVLQPVSKLYAVPHVFAEVSNLIDLQGDELNVGRGALLETIEVSDEQSTPSLLAAQHRLYPRLGLTDAAIVLEAEQRGFAALTDDLQLYLALLTRGIPVINFTHIREHSW